METKMTEDQAVSVMKKIVHALKTYEKGLEALQVSRTAEARVNILVAEGDQIVSDIKILKDNKRGAIKQVETWEAKAKQAEKDASEKGAKAEATMRETFNKSEEKVKSEILKLEVGLSEAKKIHSSEMEVLAKRKAHLQGEVNSLQSSLTGLVSQVERIGR